ncbi:MAG: formate/nitrite transporter family protein [Bacilli bacterium]|nr:formate/nitrite transporter family protein [Bacilli bacterium]
MNHYLKVIVSSFVAGLIMALAGFELIAMEANGAFVAGAFVQGFGLLLALFFNLELYNCHLCNVINDEDKKKALISLIISLIINIGTIIAFAYLFRLGSNEKKEFIDAANKFVNAREIATGDIEGKSWYMSIITGFMCGLICFIGGVAFKRSNNGFVKVISPILAVGIFVVCGFENLMTNTLYIAYAQRWTLGTFLNLVMVLIGNTLGVFFAYFAIKLIDQTFSKKKN